MADRRGAHPATGAKATLVDVERAVFVGPMRAGFRIGMERLLRDGLLGWQRLWPDHPMTELWKRLALAWNLTELFDQIEERQRTLADLGDRFLTRVQDDTSRTLNTAVFALTLISSVGVVAALIDFSQDGGLGHQPSRARWRWSSSPPSWPCSPRWSSP